MNVPSSTTSLVQTLPVLCFRLLACGRWELQNQKGGRGVFFFSLAHPATRKTPMQPPDIATWLENKAHARTPFKEQNTAQHYSTIQYSTKSLLFLTPKARNTNTAGNTHPLFLILFVVTNK